MTALPSRSKTIAGVLAALALALVVWWIVAIRSAPPPPPKVPIPGAEVQ